MYFSKCKILIEQLGVSREFILFGKTELPPPFKEKQDMRALFYYQGVLNSGKYILADDPTDKPEQRFWKYAAAKLELTLNIYGGMGVGEVGGGQGYGEISDVRASAILTTAILDKDGIYSTMSPNGPCLIQRAIDLGQEFHNGGARWSMVALVKMGTNSWTAAS